MNLFVHIGFPKSGTTTLQENLFANHPDINCLGRPNHGTGDYRAFRAALAGDGFSAETVSQTKSFIHSRAVANKVNVVSDETLCLEPYPSVMLERLLRACPDTHIVLTIRNQYDAIRSIYVNHGQMLKNAPAPYRGRHVTFANFLAHAIGTFEKDHRGDLAALDYASLYTQCAALFGTNRVHVLLFEELAAHPNRFSQRLSKVLGIPADGIAERLRMPPRNPAASQRSSTFNKYRSKVPVDVSFSRLVPGGGALRRGLHSYLGKGQAKTQVEWTEDQRREVVRLFGAGNKKLAEKLGLDLECLEYPTGKVLE